MFAQTHAFEQFDGIGAQDLPRALARIDSEQNCNQSAHDMGIAVAGKSQHRAAGAIRAHGGVEPDLACAALNLIGIAMRRVGQRRQFAPQLNQIAIAIVPVVQDRKIADDLVNVSHCVQARMLVARVGFYYIESNTAQVDISAGRVRLGRSRTSRGDKPPPSCSPKTRRGRLRRTWGSCRSCCDSTILNWVDPATPPTQPLPILYQAAKRGCMIAASDRTSPVAVRGDESAFSCISGSTAPTMLLL